MSFLVNKKQISYYYTYFCHQKIEGEIRLNGSRLSPYSSFFFFFEDWDFFPSKLGNSHLNSIWNGAEFRPLRTHKKSLSFHI